MARPRRDRSIMFSSVQFCSIMCRVQYRSTDGRFYQQGAPRFLSLLCERATVLAIAYGHAARREKLQRRGGVRRIAILAARAFGTGSSPFGTGRNNDGRPMASDGFGEAGAV